MARNKRIYAEHSHGRSISYHLPRIVSPRVHRERPWKEIPILRIYFKSNGKLRLAFNRWQLVGPRRTKRTRERVIKVRFHGSRGGGGWLHLNFNARKREIEISSLAFNESFDLVANASKREREKEREKVESRPGFSRSTGRISFFSVERVSRFFARPFEPRERWKLSREINF